MSLARTGIPEGLASRRAEARGLAMPATTRAPAPPSTWSAVAGRWLARLRERADMARMTPREMRDAGITPYDIERECAKPFWRD